MWTMRTLRGMAGMNGQSKHVSSAAVQHPMTRGLFTGKLRPMPCGRAASCP